LLYFENSHLPSSTYYNSWTLLSSINCTSITFIFSFLLAVLRELLSSLFYLLYLMNSYLLSSIYYTSITFIFPFLLAVPRELYLPSSTYCTSWTLIFCLLFIVPREFFSSLFNLLYLENSYLSSSTYCTSRTLSFISSLFYLPYLKNPIFLIFPVLLTAPHECESMSPFIHPIHLSPFIHLIHLSPFIHLIHFVYPLFVSYLPPASSISLLSPSTHIHLILCIVFFTQTSHLCTLPFKSMLRLLLYFSLVTDYSLHRQLLCTYDGG
jgi:hypothetical protein